MSTQISSNVNYVLEQLNATTDEHISMKITYGNEIIDGNIVVNKEIAMHPPLIEIKGDEKREKASSWTLVFLDPDAPSATEPLTGPFLHWILANFDQKDGSDGKHICEYRGPGPRAGSGRHRYIFLLYQSNGIIIEEKSFVEIEQRRRFPLEEFVGKHHLQLMDVKFFTIDA